MFPTPRALRTALPTLLTWRGWRRICHMSYAAFVDGFVHELGERERRAAFDEHVIPTPGRPYFQAAFAPFHRATAVDWRRADRAPLLIVAGDRDRTAPIDMVRANHRAYRRSAAVTEWREFTGRSHWTIAEPGWEEVAHDTLRWARRVSRR